jgi:hypothetical protein
MIRWALRRPTDEFDRDGNYDASYKRDMIDASRRAARLFSRVTDLLAAAVAGAVWLAAAAVAHAQQTDAVTVYTMTSERITASTAILIGLIGAVIGGLALARSGKRIGTGNGRRGAIVALVLGPIGLVIGGMVVATADGSLGTGQGLGGGIVAMVVGLIAVALGGLALVRPLRTV